MSFLFSEVKGLKNSTPRIPFVMALIYFFLGVIAHSPAHASNFWTGPKITFTKANFADWTLAANQDRITDNVWLTRADSEGIFNIAPGEETQYDRIGFTSPSDTEWALGSISTGIQNLVFKSWSATVGSPPFSVNQNMVVHLKTDDIYIDIKFLSWQSGREGFGGGGFSYERSTPAAPVSTAVPSLPLMAQAGLVSMLLIITIKLMRKPQV